MQREFVDTIRMRRMRIEQQQCSIFSIFGINLHR